MAAMQDILIIKETNPAAQFAQKVNGAPVIASDGTVYAYREYLWLFGDMKYTSKGDDSFKELRNKIDATSKRKNEGWIEYRYSSGTITTSQSKGKSFTLEKMMEDLFPVPEPDTTQPTV